MCRTWTITYLCGHTCPFRLSTCLGHHTLPSKHDKPSCSGATCLTFSSSACCGPCSKEDAEMQLKDEWASIRARLAVRTRRASVDRNVAPPAEGELERREAEFERRLWVLQKEFPSDAAKRWRKPGGAEVEKRKREGSQLKREVRSEDVVVEDGWETYGWVKETLAREDEEVEDEASEQGDAFVDEDESAVEAAHSAADKIVEEDSADLEQQPDVSGAHDLQPLPELCPRIPFTALESAERKPMDTKPVKGTGKTSFTIKPLRRPREKPEIMHKPQDLGRPLAHCRIPNLVELTIGT